MQCALAVDIGGTKLAAALVDADGVVHAARSVSTAGVDAEALFATLVALIDGVVADGVSPARSSDAVQIVVCGVGCGGPMAPHGETVSPLNIGQWREFPLRARLRAHVGVPVHVDNDAKALALGEGWRGAAQGERNFLAMVVSTGVGAGLVVDGVLLDGGAGNAGHIGHVLAVPGGRRCACGAAGCLEAEVSGTAIAASTGRPAWEAPLAVRVRAGRLVGEVLGSVVHLLDLRMAVVAGSVALGFGAPFFVAAQEALDATARLAFARGARVVPAGLGAAGPLVGAAAVGWRAMGVDVGVHAAVGSHGAGSR